MNQTLIAPLAETKDIALDSSGILGHPRALTTLFFTEMWERFSYYGMRALLILYMTAAISEGGLGFSIPTAAMIYGTYTMLVYMTSIPGGFVADRFLGARAAVFWGGVVIALGHFMLVFPALPTFFAGLGAIVLGTGLLKPNMTQLVGRLYVPGDARRDGGFSIFYMGINIGAMLSPLVCGYLAQSSQFKNWLQSVGFDPLGSWHWGFAAAGIGMTFGLMQYAYHRQRLRGIGEKPQLKGAEKTSAHALTAAEGDTADGAEPLNRAEWRRIGAIAVLFFFSALFWAIYEQGGSSLNMFADRLTNNEIFGMQFPSSWFQSLPAFFVIALAPVFSVLWLKLGNRQPSSPAKFAIGLAFLGAGILVAAPATMLAGHGKVSVLWLTGIYFLQVIGEMCLSPVGLSTVTGLAPRRILGLTTGIWFVSMALGNFAAGWLGGFFNEKDLPGLASLFTNMGVAVLLASALLFALTPTVKRLMGLQSTSN